MASTYLSRTFGTATNRKKFTISLWFKKSSNSSNQQFLDTGVDGSNQDGFKIHSSQALKFNGYESGTTYELQSNALLRDSSAWYHAVVSFDSTQSTSTDRLKMYLNGEQITSFSGATYPSLNFEPLMNKNTAHFIGSTFSNSNYFDGVMSNFEFVDGQQYGPEYFGSTDSNTGIWTPQASSTIADYGTNGFKLKMDTTTPGADTSGKSNNFTPSGTPTLTQGSPSNVYATFNPLARFPVAPTYSNGNNTITAGAGGSGSSPFSTIGASSGKYYAEFSLGSVNGGGISCGIIDITQFNPNFQTDAWFYYPTYGYAYISNNGKKANNNAESNYANSYTNGDKIGVAMDLDNNKLYFAKNGVWQNSGDPTSGATGTGSAFTIADGTYGFAVYGYQEKIWNANFGEGFFGTTAAGTNADDNGQGLFAYDVPAGYYAMNTKNLEAYG